MKALKHSFGHGIWSKGGIERKWKSNMAKFPVEQFDSHDTAKVEASTPMLISGRVSSHCCWKSVLQSEKHKLPVLEKRLRTFQQKWAVFHPSLAGTALLCSAQVGSMLVLRITLTTRPPFQTPGNLLPHGLEILSQHNCSQLCPSQFSKRSPKLRALGYPVSRRHREMLCVTF